MTITMIQVLPAVGVTGGIYARANDILPKVGVSLPNVHERICVF